MDPPPSLQPAAVRAGPPVGVSPCTRTLLSPGGGDFLWFSYSDTIDSTCFPPAFSFKKGKFGC